MRCLLLCLLGIACAHALPYAADPSCSAPPPTSPTQALDSRTNRTFTGETLVLNAGVYSSAFLPIFLTGDVTLECEAGVRFVGCGTTASAIVVSGANNIVRNCGVFAAFSAVPIDVSPHAALHLSDAHFTQNLPAAVASSLTAGFGQQLASDSLRAPSYFRQNSSFFAGASFSAAPSNLFVGAGVLRAQSMATVVVDRISASDCLGAPGALFFVDSGATLNVADSIFNNTLGWNSGVVTVAAGASASLSHVNTTHTVAVSLDNVPSAGVAFVGRLGTAGMPSATASLILSHCNISFAAGASAGVLDSASPSHCTITQSTLTQSQSTSDEIDDGGAAGALRVVGQEAQLVVDDSIFSHNSAREVGGAIAALSRAHATVTRSVFSANIANIYGGDIFACAGANVSLSACAFNGSSASVGGSLYATGRKGTIVVSDNSIFDFTVAKFGGAIGSAESGRVFVDGGHILHASAFGGGALWAGGRSSVRLTGVEIRDSRSEIDGGAARVVQESTVLLDGCAITGNYAPRGAAVAAIGLSKLDVLNSDVTFNRASYSGGVVYSDNLAVVTFDHCHLDDNVAVIEGGGVAALQSASTVNLLHSSAIRNASPRGGVVFQRHSSTFVMRECRQVMFNRAVIGNNTLSGDGGIAYVEEQAFENDLTRTVANGISHPKVMRRDVDAAIIATVGAAGVDGLYTEPDHSILGTPQAVAKLNMPFHDFPKSWYINTTILNCTAARDGGFFKGYDTNFYLKNSTIVYVVAGRDGGVIWDQFVKFNTSEGFRQDDLDPLAPEEPYANLIYRECDVHHCTAGGRGGSLHINQLPIDEMAGRFYINSNSYSYQMIANVGGLFYASDVSQVEFSEAQFYHLLNVYAQYTPPPPPGSFLSHAVEWGDEFATSEFKLCMPFTWGVQGDTACSLVPSFTVYSGELLQAVMPPVQLIDVAGTIVTTSFDRYALEIGACQTNPRTQSPGEAPVVFGRESIVTGTMEKGQGSVSGVTVYGEPGQYCVHARDTSISNMIPFQFNVTIVECSRDDRVIYYDFLSQYPACKAQSGPPEVESILSVSLAVLLLLVMLVSLCIIQWRRTHKATTVAGRLYMLCVLAGLSLALVIPLMWRISATRASCIGVIWVGHLSFVFVFAPMWAKVSLMTFLTLTQRRTVQLTVPNDKLRNYLSVSLALVIPYLVFWSAIDDIEPQQLVDSNGSVYQQCVYSSGFSIALLICEGVLLSSLFVQLWMRRAITTLYNESARLSYCFLVVAVYACTLMAIYFIVLESYAGGDDILIDAFVIGAVLSVWLLALYPIVQRLLRRSWESTGNEVFISYASTDKVFVNKLRDSLSNEGFGVYVDSERSEAGAVWRHQVAQAIQASRIVIFVVSPKSYASSYCKEELQFAFDEKKHIFPIIRQKDFGEGNDPGLDMLMKTYHWALFDNPSEFELNTQKLLRTILYTLQKQSLEYAVENVEHYRQRYRLKYANAETELAAHTRFQDYFLSWSHDDADFVRHRLYVNLSDRKCEPWADFLGLRSGDDWRSVIGEAISHCKIMIYVLSSSSVISQYCQEELLYALECNKKIVTVLVDDVQDILVHGAPALANLLTGWPVVDMRDMNDYTENLAHLLRLLRNKEFFDKQAAIDNRKGPWVELRAALTNAVNRNPPQLCAISAALSARGAAARMNGTSDQRDSFHLSRATRSDASTTALATGFRADEAIEMSTHAIEIDEDGSVPMSAETSTHESEVYDSGSGSGSSRREDTQSAALLPLQPLDAVCIALQHVVVDDSDMDDNVVDDSDIDGSDTDDDAQFSPDVVETAL